MFKHLWLGYIRANGQRAWECGRCKAVWPKETHPPAEVQDGCLWPKKRFTLKQYIERQEKQKMVTVV